VPAIIVTGLGYGDEGKGAVVDYLARTEDRVRGVVFTNGGAQRAHNVVARQYGLGHAPSHHTFSQFSSATFVPGVRTYHAATSMVDPHAFFLEADDLVEQLIVRPWERVTVHPDALVTTPFHVAANKIHALHNGHGSCGMGIGETALDALTHSSAIRARDLLEPSTLYEKLHDTQVRLRRRAHNVGLLNGDRRLRQLFDVLHDFEPIKQALEVYRIFAKVVRIEEFEIDADESDPDQTWIFEGSQGVLLDEYVGFHPHTTWSKTAGQNPRSILGGYSGEVRHVGVMRSYMTRHGAGPFVTEDKDMDDDPRFAEAHNGLGEWQGSWRRGWTDFAALRYAIRVAQPTELAITHMDRVRDHWRICAGYDVSVFEPKPNLEREVWEVERAATLDLLETAIPSYMDFTDMTPEDFVDFAEAGLGVPVSITAYGPTADDFRGVLRPQAAIV
jgi:adenylosuccinate synthase